MDNKLILKTGYINDDFIRNQFRLHLYRYNEKNRKETILFLKMKLNKRPKFFYINDDLYLKLIIFKALKSKGINLKLVSYGNG